MRASRVIILVPAVLAAMIVSPLLAGKKDKSKDAPKETAAPVVVEVEETVAFVGDVPITLEQVDASIAGRLAKVRQDEYDLRRAALDEMIAEQLFEDAAEARGITVDELMKTEVEAKASQPTQEQITQYYNANQSRDRGIQGKTLEQATPLIQQMMQQQMIAGRRQQYVDELEAQSSVRVMLDPPRAKVTIPEGAPTKGPAGAPIVLVEYSDYQCPYCKRAQGTIDQLLTEYGDKIQLVYLDFPLSFHQRAMPASVAALCAGEQDKYWEFHNSLLTVNGDFSDGDLNKRAQDLQLDMTEFAACYDSDALVQRIQGVVEGASALGVTGTPTFFVNGRMMVGALPFEQFKTVIEEELALLQSRVGG
jgi:protein-disulfide isomerase